MTPPGRSPRPGSGRTGSSRSGAGRLGDVRPAGRTGRAGVPAARSGPAGAETGHTRRQPGRPDGSTGRWRLVRASREAVPPSVRRFMRRARRRRLRAALPWAVAGCLAALAAVGWWVVSATSVFGVDQVRVAGAALVTESDVRQAAQIPPGTPLARVDLAAVAGRVSGLAAVERVVASRDWPGTVVITVVERVPAAVVPQGDAFVVVDGAGVAFRTLAARPDDLAVVRLETVEFDQALVRDAVAVLDSLTAQLREVLVEVVVSGPAGIELRIADDRVVIWGDATENAVKARVADALLVQDGSVIDVSAPDVVTIR
ncbi:FtsQ-type POTRA domain-containing protein [Solwaraspora sp. WMMD792]|uniref:cell division protein FtsQ/DivIB n=1 Tax=Solwaraspora sp. WMMD792 TaxID=3016099 RepID=UPI0024173045|nr:FtsQ-type POTRA domain-containing protein [Solwaraspora sp. WMMD792]MDG4771912.1 FtsQ-type POTRA domain-containing protein [Solwaraspora sp. WMMD792]